MCQLLLEPVRDEIARLKHTGYLGVRGALPSALTLNPTRTRTLSLLALALTLNLTLPLTLTPGALPSAAELRAALGRLQRSGLGSTLTLTLTLTLTPPQPFSPNPTPTPTLQP